MFFLRSWVFSSELSHSQLGNHAIYKPSNASSKLSGGSWQISYGDGSSASGDVYKDAVALGGLTVQKQAVEAASHISSQFAQEPSDGLMGLAFSSINTVKPQPQQTWFDSVKGQLSQPLFAASLKHNAPGTYDFGFTDNKKYKGKITYTSVDNSQGFWQFEASGYSIGNGQSSQSSLSGIAGK